MSSVAWIATLIRSECVLEYQRRRMRDARTSLSMVQCKRTSGQVRSTSRLEPLGLWSEVRLLPTPPRTDSAGGLSAPAPQSTRPMFCDDESCIAVTETVYSYRGAAAHPVDRLGARKDTKGCLRRLCNESTPSPGSPAGSLP